VVYVTRVLVSLHVAAGGDLQTMVAHGSALQALFAQPYAHGVSVGV